MAEEQKFPTEVIDLPSEGKLYPKDSPLSDGKIEIKYMTAKEEDILTSANLIKKGLAVDTLLNSLIVDKDIILDDLILGDKNAVMVAARVLAYGPEYICDIKDPNTGDTITHTFNLAECPFKKLPKGITENNFEINLPVSKKKVTFKVLTGKEEKLIEKELASVKKLGTKVSPELTTRLRYVITSVDGDESQPTVNSFVQNMLARDSLFLRHELQKISPDIEMKQSIDIGGDVVEVDVPLTTEFFWPSSQ
ncbi:MAG: hypothetical protein CBC24_03155 [Candidatus Pelagibacter sp. TMED64]|nr:MAG: hypothetical protein CBC24_03155 [Candidatus Pelagibacter sp. TMED64]|tara:strand:+ start:82 stop:831 length:750 start_codon:yes stop_codon:yes gene_type:complete